MLRDVLFAKEPLCRTCGAAATIRDHIIPIAEGGTDDSSNIQALCKDCSDAKTHQESKRGIRR